MPLEIRELVIKVTIEEKANKNDFILAEDKEELKKSIVDECVDIIMTKLEQISER